MTGTPIGQPTWDPYKTSGPTPWQKCGQYLGEMWVGFGTYMEKVDKNRMGPYGLLIWAHIVAYMSPI